MKHLFTITLLVISLITTAQNTATPSNIEGKDIYVFLVNIPPSDYVETVQLTKEQMVTVTNFENRIETLLSNATSSNYDAITTRDGSTIQLLKYKNSASKVDATVPNYFGKEVYFLATPTKEYKVVDSKEISSIDLKKPFYNVAETYAKNDKATFDALIISGNTAQYIQYK